MNKITILTLTLSLSLLCPFALCFGKKVKIKVIKNAECERDQATVIVSLFYANLMNHIAYEVKSPKDSSFPPKRNFISYAQSTTNLEDDIKLFKPRKLKQKIFCVSTNDYLNFLLKFSNHWSNQFFEPEKYRVQYRYFTQNCAHATVAGMTLLKIKDLSNLIKRFGLTPKKAFKAL